MTNAKHTPAPWDYLASNNSSLMLIETPLENKTGAGIHIASLAGKNNEQTIANARLIAAAPELLEVCKTAWAYCCENLAQEMWMKELVDAIAKAEGK